MSTQQKRNSGFTIIEVLIVLAIAAVIMLVVFLAVPALQRNSRNTQRKNDVAAVLAGVNEFETNNNGQMPSGTWTIAGGALTVVGAAGTTSSEAKVQFYNAGVNAATNGFVNHVAANTVTAANMLNAANKDYLLISTGTTCSGNASVAGPARSVSVIYEIESGTNTYAQQCQSS